MTRITIVIIYLVLTVSAQCSTKVTIWLEYTDPGQHYTVLYPSIARPEFSKDVRPGLLSQTAFVFDQKLENPKSGSSVSFSLQISIWDNPRRLDASEWAKVHTNPKLTSVARTVTVSQLRAYMVRTTDLLTWTVNIFVSQANKVYQISYLDVISMDLSTKALSKFRWKAIVDKIVESFQVQSARG